MLHQTTPRSFCSKEESVKLMIDLVHLVSSAKRNNEELDTQSGRLLIYTRKRRGPRMGHQKGQVEMLSDDCLLKHIVIYET